MAAVTTRQAYLLGATEDELGSNPRFGLFSHPVSNNVGDVAYVAPTRKRDAAGKVPLGMKRFSSGPMKKGNMDQCLFSAPKYSIEPYQDQGQFRSTLRGARPKSAAAHGRAFRPSFKGQKVVTSEFEHFQDYSHKEYTK